MSDAVRDWKTLILAATFLGPLAGCSQAPTHYEQMSDHTGAATLSTVSSGHSAAVARAPEPTGVSYFGSYDDAQRLEKLWQERTETRFSDFAIGPGDQIRVILPDVKDLANATVKVSATGDISLPLIGKIHASGMTEPQLREELRQRLLKFMYDPQFQLSVKQYQSRQVAVLGAVGRPGVITLASASETILEALGQAGGPTATAADRVILIPANPSQTAPNPQTMAEAVAMVNPGARERPDMAGQRVRREGSEAGASVRQINAPDTRMPSPRDGPLAAFAGLNASPVVISLHSDSPNGSGRFLNMPLRPGDVLVVPGAGRVAVLGWVNNPGSFTITQGSGVLSAIGAAGGPLYAADETDVHLIRTTASGSTKTISLNLDKIMSGQESDIPLQGNDVIEVGYSTLKMIPYALAGFWNSKVYLPMPYFY